MRHRITLTAVLAILTVLAAASAAAAAATPLGYDGQHLRRDPGYIVYSGDGGAFLAGRGSTFTNLHWTQWGETTARAWGADWHNACVPDCADAAPNPYRANITLSRPRMLAGRRVFTRMTVTYTGAQPPYPYHKPSWSMSVHYDPQYGYGFWQ